MKFTAIALTIAFTFGCFGPAALNTAAQSGNDYVALYRLYNAQNRDRIYTTSCDEKNTIIRNGGFADEGVAGYIASRQLRRTMPLYRLLLSSGVHFYTTDNQEMTNLSQTAGNKSEGIVGYVANSQMNRTVPFYRLLGSDRHLYTTNEQEKNNFLQNSGNKSEGVAGYLWSSGRNQCDGGSGGGSPLPGNFPLIYAQADFQGPAQAIERDFAGSRDWEGNPHVIRSIRVPQGWYLVLYEKRNYKGKSYNLNADWTPQPGDGWYGRIKSIKVYQGTPPKQPR
ncbi:MAG: beta/gamma crystallin-related protein [Acidobacteriota bacterium]|nr:beta/gamma crystallin-related protein [Acidobacteriota bacterium]